MKKVKKKIAIEFEIEYDLVIWDGGEIPKTVYKYRNWENPKHKSILKELSIWVPDSYDFNDPFDCSIPVAYDLMINDDNLVEKFYRKIYSENPKIPRDKIELEVQKSLVEKRHGNPNFIANYTNEMLHSYKKESGIFSVTPINDNILMWSHYANSHKGICIGFDAVKLFEYWQGFGGAGDITYKKDYPIISPIDEDTKQFIGQSFTKSIHWSYEVEYRLYAFNKTNVSIKIPSEAVTEVIFGAKMPDVDKIEIKQFLKDKLPHVKCFSAIPDNKNFKINLTPDN